MDSTTLHIRDEWRDRIRSAGLACFDTLMNTTDGELISRHARGSVLRMSVAGRTLYLKRDAYTKLKEAVRDLAALRRPEPFTEHERQGLELAARQGVAGPEPVAWGQRRRWGLPFQGVLLMTALPGASLDIFLREVGDPAARMRAMAAAGRAIGRLYRGGVSWPDLRVKHVYIDGGRAALLDLERLRPVRRPGGKLRRQMSRFLVELRGCGATPEEAAALTAAVRKA